MRVCVLFPHPAEGPVGGYKVALDYAGALADDGCDVDIVYSGSIFWSHKPLKHKITNVIRYLQQLFKGYSSERWMHLNPKIREHLSLSLNERHVPKADVYIATSPYTAWYLNKFSRPSKRFYFIQDYENWGPGLRAILEGTYHAPLQKIVISKWLQELLKTQHSESSIMVPNGFDFQKFHTMVNPADREPATVSMLWHDMERKDCRSGLKAIVKVKAVRPDLRVHLFGAPARPSFLPEWIVYTQQPSDTEHLAINNNNAIFLATSLQEGWGLTVGEAMACSQAVVCTDTEGFMEMARDGCNALVVPKGDVDAMAQAVVNLIDDNEMRIRLTLKGAEDIRRFDILESRSKFVKIIKG